MKTIIQIQHAPAQGWSINDRYAERITRLYRFVAEFAGEVRATIAGIFEMQSRRPLHDKYFERLNDNLLSDIGYERGNAGDKLPD